MTHRHLLAGALLLLGLGAHARDLSVMQDYTGRYTVYGADGAGFHRVDVPLGTVESIEVGAGMAHVRGDNQTHLLYGMTPKGISQRRIDLELGSTVAEFWKGDRIMVVRGMLVYGIYAVTDEGIQARFLRVGVRRVEVEGNLAYLETDAGRFLFGPSRDKVATLEMGFGPAPDRMMLARDQALIWRGRRITLHYVNEEGFHSRRVDEAGQAPKAVFLGGYAGNQIIGAPGEAPALD